MWDVKKILLTTDGSSNAEKAYEPAIHMAKNNGAELIGIYVMEVPALDAAALADTNLTAQEVLERMEDYESVKAEKILKKLEGLMQEVNFRKLVTRNGSAADVIIDTARKEGVDLIVMGTKGCSGTKRFVGSTFIGVMNNAHCAVLAIR